jgi:hypothetical protein
MPSSSGGLCNNTITQVWSYAAGSPVVTPAAISASDYTIVNSQDLYVHGINSANGQRVWRVKPTNRTYQSGNLDGNGAQFEDGWPVIAEGHGIVFIRYRLDWNTLWTWNPFPTTNAQIQANLQSNANQQALFALKLLDGTQAFVPNAEMAVGDESTYGTKPVIRMVGGHSCIYIWRNGLTCGGCLLRVLVMDLGVMEGKMQRWEKWF